MTNLERAIISNQEVAAGLDRLTEAILEGVPRDVKRWRRTVFGLVALAGVILWTDHRQGERIDRGVRCVVEQMAEHRISNQNTHDVLAEAHDLPATPAEGGLPSAPPVAEVLRVCRPFYEATP